MRSVQLREVKLRGCRRRCIKNVQSLWYADDARSRCSGRRRRRIYTGPRTTEADADEAMLAATAEAAAGAAGRGRQGRGNGRGHRRTRFPAVDEGTSAPKPRAPMRPAVNTGAFTSDLAAELRRRVYTLQSTPLRAPANPNKSAVARRNEQSLRDLPLPPMRMHNGGATVPLRSCTVASCPPAARHAAQSPAKGHVGILRTETKSDGCQY